MIQRYTDHAANERTFLQWLQISVLIMFMVRAHASCPAK